MNLIVESFWCLKGLVYYTQGSTDKFDTNERLLVSNCSSLNKVISFQFSGIGRSCMKIKKKKINKLNIYDFLETKN